jgi:RHS repeat-associated protein
MSSDPFSSFLGRRIRKLVWQWDAPNEVFVGPTQDTKYVYDGWRVIMELDGLNGDAVTRKYTWGLDLAGLNGQVNSLEAAGGIGGLLAAEDVAQNRKFIYFADGNGNIGQVVEATPGSEGTIVAKYEYDPYGRRINAPAQGEYDQPYRFSTKPFDEETGLGYWGYRWYSPRTGRWINRDPVSEPGNLRVRQLYRGAYASDGALNAYSYALQNPLKFIDPVGLRDCCGPDITSRLTALLAAFDEKFRAADETAQCSACFAMIGADGWDISELHLAGLPEGHSPFEGKGYGSRKCAGTVTINGRCYRANEVNYILWGRAFLKCNRAFEQWSRHEESGYGKLYGPILNTGPQLSIQTTRLPCGECDGSNPFTVDSALSYVKWWRRGVKLITSLDANASGPGNTICRQEWTRRGFFYTGGLAGIDSRCDAGCETSVREFDGMLSGHIGGISGIEFYVP